ncbi:MAG: flavin reductase family protein, partial [Pseudomonadota bacterium]|nr:flavin reductase family protein [Pseudomonadota bacterium]
WMAITGETYQRIGRAAAGAVTIVATRDRSNALVGLTVSSFVTLSFDPPLVMFAIQHDASSYPAIVASREFGVSVLEARQAGIARRFSVKGADKAAGVEMLDGELLPVPLIAGALAHVECRTSQIFISGDHAIVVGLVEAARARDGDPLLYYARRYGTFTALPES